MEEIKDVAGNQESRNMALLIWIGTIFFGFIPGLIFYLIKKDGSSAESVVILRFR